MPPRRWVWFIVSWGYLPSLFFNKNLDCGQSRGNSRKHPPWFSGIVLKQILGDISEIFSLNPVNSRLEIYYRPPIPPPPLYPLFTELFFSIIRPSARRKAPWKKDWNSRKSWNWFGFLSRKKNPSPKWNYYTIFISIAFARSFTSFFSSPSFYCKTISQV